MIYSYCEVELFQRCLAFFHDLTDSLSIGYAMRIPPFLYSIVFKSGSISKKRRENMYVVEANISGNFIRTFTLVNDYGRCHNNYPYILE